jgi:hypothetical protein
MLEERGAQSDAEPVLRRTEAVTAVPDTTVPETAVPETGARSRAPAASPGKPLPAPRSEWAITGVYRDPVTWAIVFAVFGAYTALSLFRLLQLNPTSWGLGIYTEYVKQHERRAVQGAKGSRSGQPYW